MKIVPNVRYIIVSTILILPAFVLCLLGILYTMFGIDGANHVLDRWFQPLWGRILFSPITVLGGVCLSLALSAAILCRVRMGAENDAVVLSVEIRKVAGQLIVASMGILLLSALLLYAFVENFKIIPR